MGLNPMMRLKKEMRSFFGLTVMNLALAAMALGLGVALIIPNLTEMWETGHLLALPLLNVAVGLASGVLGLVWLTQTAEILDGFDDVRTAYGDLKEGDAESMTGLAINMTAYYRSNKPIISRMAILARVGAFLFIITGAASMVSAGASIAASGLLVENGLQLLGGIIATGVGITGLFLSHYFSIYSKVWDTRLQEAQRVEEALQEQMEAK